MFHEICDNHARRSADTGNAMDDNLNVRNELTFVFCSA